ncbi:MAG TPA: hypothetical protein VLE69_00275 [Candidatus Saccharimonadales bacterium]|nr:hypothetical protein [Candidatus Saccharimonadales bacterium]
MNAREYFREIAPEEVVRYAKILVEVADERHIALDGLASAGTPYRRAFESALTNPTVDSPPDGTMDIVGRITEEEAGMFFAGSYLLGKGNEEFLRTAIRDEYFILTRAALPVAQTTIDTNSTTPPTTNSQQATS